MNYLLAKKADLERSGYDCHLKKEINGYIVLPFGDIKALSDVDVKIVSASYLKELSEQSKKK